MDEFGTTACEHDGVVMEAFVATPANASGRLPAVMMFPGASGSQPSFEKAASALAELGYLAFGIDIYGRGADLSSPSSVGRLYMTLLDNPRLLRARVVEWFEHIASLPNVDPDRIGAIGYCFGGKCVLELARLGADVKTVVSYHGLLSTDSPAEKDTVQAEVVAYCAGKDPYAPIEDYEAFRKEMAEAGVRHQITWFSETEHAFTTPEHHGAQPGVSYDPLAHRVAWAGTLALLDFKLKG